MNAAISQRLLQVLVDVAELKWMDDAACAEVGDDFWFPEKGTSATIAKRICAGCPVRSECLEYALEHDPRFGIWGGLGVRERERLARQRRAAA